MAQYALMWYQVVIAAAHAMHAYLVPFKEEKTSLNYHLIEVQQWDVCS